VPSYTQLTEVSAETQAEDDPYSAPGFDLVAAALGELSNISSSTEPSYTPPADVESEPDDSGGNEDLGQDAISALFAANDSGKVDPEVPAEDPVDSGELNQDAISALFAANAEGGTETIDEAIGSGELDQDAISALFAANDSPVSEPEEVDTSSP